MAVTERVETGAPGSAPRAAAWAGPLLLFAYGFVVAFWLWAKWLFSPQMFLLPPLPPVEVLITLVENILGPWIVALVTVSASGLIALDGFRFRRVPGGWWWKSLLRGSLETVLIHLAVWCAGTILFFGIMALLPGSEIHGLSTDDPVVRGLALFTAFLSLIMSGPITGLVIAARCLARRRREELATSSADILNHAVAILLVPLGLLWILSGYPRATLAALQGSATAAHHNHSAELISAARDGDASAVETLVKRGAPINGKGNSGATPLMAAAANGHLGIVQTLLKRGADPNVQDESGRTALMAAAANRQAEIVDALLGAKADVNAKEGRGKTALMLAVLADDARLVRALLAAGADTSARDAHGDTALSLAQRLHRRVIAALLQGEGGKDR